MQVPALDKTIDVFFLPAACMAPSNIVKASQEGESACHSKIDVFVFLEFLSNRNIEQYNVRGDPEIDSFLTIVPKASTVTWVSSNQ